MMYRFLAAGLLTGICSIAMAVSSPMVPEPPMSPDNYANGPVPPLLSDTGIFPSEKAAYALLEGVLQQAEAIIAATSCTNSAGIFDIFIYADGSIKNPDFNFVTVDSPASTVTLTADVYTNNPFRGQSMKISQAGIGAIKRVRLISHTGYVFYNAQSSIMTMNSVSAVIGINGLPNAYQGEVIKDFYRTTDDATGLPYIIDWGMQSVSKSTFPIEQYWQRSRSLRDDSVIGRTVFVKDRLIGPSSCRIVIDISGYNNANYFWQSGTLTISTDSPGLEYPFDF